MRNQGTPQGDVGRLDPESLVLHPVNEKGNKHNDQSATF